MKKSLALLFICLPFFAACTQPVEPVGVDVLPEGDSSMETTNQEELIKEASQQELKPETEPELNVDNLSLPSYYHNADITYYNDPVKLNGSLFSAEQNQKVFDDYVKAGGYAVGGWEYLSSLLNWQEVGVIQKAPYEEWTLLILNVQCEGPCFETGFYRFAYHASTDEVVYLPQYSSPLEGEEKWLPTYLENQDVKVSLSGINLPESVEIPGKNANITLQKIDARYDLDLSEESPFKSLFKTEELGDFYGTGGNGCFYYVKPDGTAAIYVYEPDIQSPLPLSEGESLNLGESYALDRGACGISYGCYPIYDLKKEELKEVGKNASGISFYELKDPKEMTEEEIYKVGAEQTANLMINRHFHVQDGVRESAGKPPLTFNEFLAAHPILFWEDPLGRLSSITHKDFENPAECAKPVIYLYPEQTEKVEVAVQNIEFTKTVPDHGAKGWTVLAQPDGNLINEADGQEYPYLFWEGHSETQLPVTSGFTVPRGDLESFLKDSLTQLGLNKTEQADFMEFWYERMLENPEPYFFISFVGTQDFNKVAPLRLEPKPDTLIRVFMYYDPIFEPLDLPQQKLSTLPRKGFTVVEWGGTASVPLL